ncbi:unnamed protein product, partial [Staurois parvus]
MTRDCDDHSQSQAHAHQRGKTVQRWSEEQVRPCRRQTAERPARYSDMVAAEIP